MTGSFPDADHRCSAFARGNTLTAKLFLVTAFWDRTRSVQPGGPTIESTEKVRVRPNGKVIIKEKVKSRDR